MYRGDMIRKKNTPICSVHERGGIASVHERCFIDTHKPENRAQIC